MKRILLLSLLLLFAFFGQSQNKIAKNITELQNLKTSFRPISALTVISNGTNTNISKVVDGATVASLKSEAIANVVTNQYETISLEVPYQNQILTVLLYKVDPFAEGFHVDTNKALNIPYQKGVYYRGILNGDYGSVAAFNFFNGEFNGVVSNSELGNVVVGKLNKPNNTNDYIVYSDAKMKVLNDFDCHTKDDMDSDQPTTQNRDGQSTRCVTMYFEIDYDLFSNNGSSTTDTTNWMTSVFNNVQTLFNNDGITVALKSLYIWTTPDPYEGIGTSSSDYLFLFNDVRPVFDGDIGQLVGIDDGGLGGVAVTINGLCTQNNFSYSDVFFNFEEVPIYSWTINVITHEFGHLMGSRHTHGCYWNGDNTAIDGCGPTIGAQYTEGNCPTGPIPTSGTIMSYCHLVSGVGVNFSNGFGPQPAQAILNRVNNGSCLSFDCVNTCINMITSIVTTNVTNDSVAFSWTDTNPLQTSWEVSVTPFSSTAIVWQTAMTNSYAIGNLDPNTYYKIRVRSICASGLIAANNTLIFATPAFDFCDNVTFSDTGGTSGNYTNNESFIRTMLPNGNGLKIRATFSSFDLELDYDYLYVYNGPDDTFDDLSLGGFTGSDLPPVLDSTHSSGALTFKFYSDQGVVESGWIANISCTGTLGLESNDYIDFTYSPNPTNGNVAITSKTVIANLAVYSVTGQLLHESNPRNAKANVDISGFAVGTYFFRLQFEGDQQVNFKILKN